MSPTEFKSRFLSGLPEIPPDLDLKLDEFIRFPARAVDKLNISEADKALLTVSGLPRNAPPFLNFGFRDRTDILKSMSDFGLPDKEYGRYKMIGSTGNGDMICIDDASDGAVVYLNHDQNMQVVFMNSSVAQLAECLCVFQEFMRNNDGGACRRAIQLADPKAMADANHWPYEIDCQDSAGR